MYSQLDWNEIVSQMQKLASSEVGRFAISEIKPCETPEAALTQVREIEDMRQVLAFGLRPQTKSLDLFSTWFERLQRQAVLKPLELRDVRHFCIEVLALKETFESAPPTNFTRMCLAQLLDAKKPLSAIDQILGPDGEILTDASERLYSLFKEKQSKEREIRSHLDRLVKSHSMETLLQDRYVTNREGRWVLPIRSGMQHDLDGIIHDVSQTKQTVFMEPQAVVQINNQLRQVEAQIDEEIERLLKQLSLYLASLNQDILLARNILEQSDVRFAQAQFADKINATIFDFHPTRLRLRNIRHPLLSLSESKNDVVANTVSLDEKTTTLILSGPNAGGKTVLLKTIGISAHMARCGLPICGEAGSELPFVKELLAIVGDAQSVDQHLSTFAAHLKMLAEGLKLKGPHSLLLVDEICGSTDPQEGAALARSFIEHYSAQGAFVVITSHLGPLKSGWAPDSCVVTASMDFDERTNQSTYRLMMGISGSSLAIKTAKKVGVPEAIVERAFELMGPEAKRREEQLSNLEAQQQELLTLKEQFRKLTNEAQDSKSRYLDLISKFKLEREKWLQKTINQAEKKIELIYEDMRKESAKNKSTYDFKAQLPQIIKTAQRPIIESAEDFEKIFSPGSSVFVKTLNQDGIVQGVPNTKGDVPILSNSMRLFVNWRDLSHPKMPINPTPILARKSGLVSLKLQSEDREVDLRGMRVEEALEKLESELDSAVQNKEERVRIIHGHGTEALKKAVRTYFSRSVYVKKWKAGDPQSGGDGITWVELE